jgi:hypothetical protein
MNVVLPSRLVAYLLSFLPLYLPLVSTFLPQSDIGLLQVRVFLSTHNLTMTSYV